MNYGNELFPDILGNFETTESMEQHRATDSSSPEAGSSNGGREEANSSWESLRYGSSSISPPETAASSSSITSEDSRSLDDLNVETLITSLLQVVNNQKSARNKKRSVQRNSKLQSKNCASLQCETCRRAQQAKLHRRRINKLYNYNSSSPITSNSPTQYIALPSTSSSPTNLILLPNTLNSSTNPIPIPGTSSTSSSPTNLIPIPSTSTSPTHYAPLSSTSTSPTFYRPKSSSPSSNKFCNIHKNSQKMYCQACAKLFCNRCEVQHHVHMNVHLRKTMECVSAHSNRIMNDVINRINILTKDLEKVQIAANNLENRTRLATNDVLLFTQQVTSALDARERELLQGIEKIREIKYAALKQRDNHLRNSIKRLIKAANRLTEAKESAIANKNPFELLLANDMVVNEMFRVKSYRQAIIIQDDYWVSFVGSEITVIEAINNFGSVTSTPPAPIGDGRALRGRGNSPQTMELQICPPSQPSPPTTLPRPRGRPISLSAFPIIVTTGRNSIFALPTTSIIIGTDGDMSENLCRPWGITCDKDGNLIIADRSNNRIQIFKEDGTFVRRFGGHGSGPGQFDRPAGVAVDARRRIIVADKDNHRIQILTMEGVHLLSFGAKGSRNGQFNYPWDVATNSECEIAVSDTRNHRVQLFSSEGIFLRKYGFEISPCMWKHFDSPRGVAFNPDGNVVVTDFNNHQVVVIDYAFLDAKVVGDKNEARVKEFLRPQGLVVDDDGNIIVSDSRNHRIQVIDSRGNLKWRFGSYGEGLDELDRPSGITLTPSGRIAVVDFGNNRVVVY